MSVFRDTGVKVKHTGTKSGIRLGGLGPHNESPNQATKRGFIHKLHETRQQRRTRLTAEVAATGQYAIVLPPQHRLRPDKLEPARPLNAKERELRYRKGKTDVKPVVTELTPAQRKRLAKKLGHSIAVSMRPR